MTETMLFEAAAAEVDLFDHHLARHRAAVPEIAAHQRVVPKAIEAGFILVAEGAEKEASRLDGSCQGRLRYGTTNFPDSNGASVSTV